MLNEKPVAEGDAMLLPAPGKVITIFPLPGIAVTVVNLIVCVAVIGVITVSPEKCWAAVLAVKKRVLWFADGVLAADIEATLIDSLGVPLFLKKVALSDASQRAELYALPARSITVTCPTPEAKPAVNGAAAEGLEVLS